jgi:thioredoxin reductase (NADPH)
LVEVKEGNIRAEAFDCAIVGAGPAGLSAAINIGRLRRTTLVIDDKQGRSTWHQINRNYLGFPDGVHATALRDLGETQASTYGAQFVDAYASSVTFEREGAERRFAIHTSAGVFRARTIILATGVSDQFPEFEGSQQCIGKSMFWCIICDGYEAIGKRVAVLGHDDHAASLALQLLVFTNDVVLVSWNAPFDIDPARLRALKEHGISMHNSDCEIYNCREEGYVESLVLRDGTEIELDLLFVAQQVRPNAQLANQLKVAVDENGYIRADAEQCTNVEGVFAAGDVTKLFSHQVTSAVHEGGMAAAAANYYLYEDWQKD